MTPQPPTISVIIRALNEAEHLPALLAGLDRQRLQASEVILVDSGSTDATTAIARAHGARVVSIAPEDFSFGRALNLGCSHASGDVFVFASAHVFPIEDTWLERLVEPFSDPQIALSYGRQTGDERTRFSELQILRAWFPEESTAVQRAPFCNNANCAIRSSWWRRVKYDESLTGLEDLAWAARVLELGGLLSYRADATIVHIHDEDFGRVRNRFRREAIAHRRIFDDQRLGTLEALMLFLSNVGRDYLSAVRSGRLAANAVDIPLFRAAQYLGAWEGFRTRGEVSADLKRRFYYPRGLGSTRNLSRERGLTSRRAS